MRYELVHPLRDIDELRSKSIHELEEYFRWFLEVRHSRISALQLAITENVPGQSLSLDQSVASMRPLGEWLSRVATQRARSAAELDVLRKKSLPGVEPPAHELTEQTLSLGFDAGIYFGESLAREYSHLEWTQYLDDKLFGDYGQPVLIGFGRVALNPLRIVTTFLYGVVEGDFGPGRLEELYLYWASRAACSTDEPARGRPRKKR